MNSPSNSNRLTSSKENDHLLTVPEVADLLKISPGTVYHLISETRIPAIKISARCVRFSRIALLLWPDHLTRAAEEPRGPLLRKEKTDSMKNEENGERSNG
jgi:excisionase family DNA binding protein